MVKNETVERLVKLETQFGQLLENQKEIHLQIGQLLEKVDKFVETSNRDYATKSELGKLELSIKETDVRVRDLFWKAAVVSGMISALMFTIPLLFK